MKKAVPVILILVIVLMLAGILTLATRYREQSAKYLESQHSEEVLRGQFTTALEAIAEIQDSLNAIAPEDIRLRHLSQETEMGARATQTQKERMLSTLADLRESIRYTRQRILELEGSLKGSQAEVTGLRRIIENFKKSISQKEAMIQRLTTKVDSLTVTVTGLRTDVSRGQQKIAEQQQVIEENQREIGRIYYVIGTKKELKAKGIINEGGGVLGVGKSVQLSSTFREEDFTALDTGQVSELTIRGEEPQILSAQSASSYQLSVGEGRATLRIMNAREFRKVKYLVILVKSGPQPLGP